MKKRFAALAATGLMASGLALTTAAPAQAAPVCPTKGGSLVVDLSMSGRVVGKGCFSYSDNRVRVRNVSAHLNHIDTRVSYNPPTEQGGWGDYDGPGKEWVRSNVFPVGKKTVWIKVCARDKNSGKVNACTSWRKVTRK